MKNRTLKFAFVTSLLIINGSAGFSQQTDTWLCIADDSTGFKFDQVQNRWISVQFNTDMVRYIVSPWKVIFTDELRVTIGQPKIIMPYSITRFGAETATFSCRSGFWRFFEENSFPMSKIEAESEINFDGISEQYRRGEISDAEVEKKSRESSSILCQSELGQFAFDKKSMRFIMTYIPGFILKNEDGTDDLHNTPNISIGTCTPL